MEANKKHLLIVDDEPDTAALVSRLLGGGRCMTHTVHSVEMAMNYLKHESVDLVITDWLLPDGTGADVCEAARATRPAIPIIVMSGVFEERSKAMKECRPSVYLPKPIRLPQLYLNVGHLLDN